MGFVSDGVGAVGDVGPGALGGREGEALAGAPGVVQLYPEGAGEGQNLGRDLRQGPDQSVAVDLGQAETAQQRVVVHQKPVHLFRQHLWLGQVAYANGPARHLVLVGRADAAPGGADPGIAQRRLPRLVQGPVQGQDKRCVFGDAQVLGA